MSERTSRHAITQVAAVLFEHGAAERVVVAGMPKLRSAMHLDTVFTFVDRDVVTLYPTIVDRIHAFSLRPSDTSSGVEVTDEGTRALVPGSQITMSFTGDSVSVDAGCNTLRGSASIEDYELVVGDLASTQTACDEALEEQDQWLASFLTSRPRFERVDDDLYLSRDDTVIHLVPDDG